MTQFPALCLIAAMFVGGSAYAASPPIPATRFSVSANLRPASVGDGRYAIDAELSAPGATARSKQADPAYAPLDAPVFRPRFSISAAFRAKGAPDLAAAPCAVDVFLMNGFE